MAEANSPGQPSSGNSSRTTLVKGQGVSLGCGTLILIALIVLIFGSRGVDDLQGDVRALRSEVAELKKSVDAQAAEIRVLQQKVDEARRGVGGR